MLKRRSRLWFAAAIAYVYFFSPSGTHAGDNKPMKSRTEQVTKAIAEARNGASPTIRYEAAQRLAALTHGIDPKKVDDKTIAEMISLIDVPILRNWVAVSLGNLGPRARIAIPKLQEILPEEDCHQVSHSAAGGIRFALTQMGVTPPPVPNCEAKKERE